MKIVSDYNIVVLCNTAYIRDTDSPMRTIRYATIRYINNFLMRQFESLTIRQATIRHATIRYATIIIITINSSINIMEHMIIELDNLVL